MAALGLIRVGTHRSRFVSPAQILLDNLGELAIHS
jgi:hypothetical protein